MGQRRRGPGHLSKLTGVQYDRQVNGYTVKLTIDEALALKRLWQSTVHEDATIQQALRLMVIAYMSQCGQDVHLPNAGGEVRVS